MNAITRDRILRQMPFFSLASLGPETLRKHIFSNIGCLQQKLAEPFF
jgi:hypothetical protein